VGPRALNVEPAFRRRRLWPWVVGAVVLLALGVWELRSHRTTGAPGPSPAGPGLISGRVVGYDGRPAVGVAVRVASGGAETRTADEGRFEFMVDQGSVVRLQAHHSDLGFAAAEVRAPSANVLLRLDPLAGVEVHVLSEGRPVPGAEVMVTARRGEGEVFHADRTTDANGTLRVLGLPDGPLEVEVRVPRSGARATAGVEGRRAMVSPVTLVLAPVGVGGGGR
jgi:hypothetical protein